MNFYETKHSEWTNKTSLRIIFSPQGRNRSVGSPQARGRIRAAAISLHHSHSNEGFELYLRPTLQLAANTGPLIDGMGLGI